MEGEKNNKRKLGWLGCIGIFLGAVILALGGFLLFLTLTEYHPEPIEPAESGSIQSADAVDPNHIRILTFNTGYASLGWESDFIMDGGKGSGTADADIVSKNTAGIQQILEQADADIYMLQEVDKHSRRTGCMDQRELYSQALPGYEWYYAPNYVCKFVPYPIQAPFGAIHSGVTTFSRFPVTEATRISLPVPFGWPVRTANLKRCMLQTRIPVGDRELVIINFHLEAYDDGEGKAAQTRQLVEKIREEYRKGNYVVAGGDFNQIFPDVDIEIKDTSYWVPGRLDPLPEDLNYLYDETSATCRLLNEPYAPEDPLTQFYLIDGFIVSPNLEVLSIETLDKDFQYSDHNPVVLEVRLPDAGN